MDKRSYYIAGGLCLVAGILLAYFGLRGDTEEANLGITGDNSDSKSKGYIAMMVVGFILILVSLVLFFVGHVKKNKNEDTGKEPGKM